jgi:hypothetical protein
MYVERMRTKSQDSRSYRPYSTFLSDSHKLASSSLAYSLDPIMLLNRDSNGLELRIDIVEAVAGQSG